MRRLYPILAIAGFTFVYAIASLTVWSGSFAFLGDSTDMVGDPSSGIAARSIAFFLTFFAGGLLAWFHPKARSVFLVVGGLLLLAGIIIRASLTGIFFTYVASIMVGVGMPCLFITWELIISKRDLRQAGFGMGISAILSGFLFLALQIPNAPLIMLTILILLVCCAILALLLYKETATASPSAHIESLQPDGTGEFHASSHRIAGAASHLWRPTLCVAALGFVSEIVRAIPLTDDPVISTVNSLSTLGIVISGLVLCILMGIRDQRPLTLTRLYQFIFPIVVTGFIVLPFFGAIYQDVFVSVCWVAFSTLVSLMMIHCVQAAQDYGGSAVAYYGMSAGVIYLFCSAGDFIGSFLNDLNRFGIAQVFMIALFSIYLLALVLLAIRSRNKNIDTVQPSEIEPIQNADLIDMKCDAVANVASLSKRELDVLKLYVRGRDTPFIASKLSISENTVRTHERNIYRKLDIHSKQELLDLIEQDESAQNV